MCNLYSIIFRRRRRRLNECNNRHSNKRDNYISIVIENVIELKSEYRITEDKNYFTIKGNELTIIGSEDKIERIQKWGNGTFKELHCNKYRKEKENV